MCNGKTAWGNSTVPSGNIGSGLAITPTYRERGSGRARSELCGGGGRLLAALARERSREDVELARRLRELAEPPQQTGEVATLAEGDPGNPEAQPRDPHHRPGIPLQQRVLQV